MKERAGKYRINLSKEAEYKSFIPNPLPPKLEIDNDLLNALISANRSLAILESMATKILNTDLFISMYVRKEALMSSQIEGTQATLEDVFDPKNVENINRDVADVVNYVRATEYAIKRLETLPLCNRLIKETHAILMAGVRGQDRNPGEFRKSQNWIGGQGSTIKTANYIPPHPQDMIKAMADLETYMNKVTTIDNLIHAALIHYQFETIHPFLDGNGRIGRLLILLFLMEREVLTTPVLYISYFLKKNRIEYYDRLNEVRNKGNYEQWIKFFLKAIEESAEDAIKTIDELNALREKNEAIIQTLGRRSKNAMRVFRYLEANPIIDVGYTAEAIGLSFNTVSSVVKTLIDLGIILQTKEMSRNRIFVYEQYLNILRNGT